MYLNLLPVGVLFAALVVSAYTDIARNRVYNWCTFPAILAGLVAGYLQGQWWGLFHSVFGLLLGVGLFILPYRFGLIGGGDVKLIGAVGALQGARFLLLSAFLTAVVGAAFGLSILIWKGRSTAALKNFGKAMLTPWRLREAAPADDTRVPYGLAIAVGTFWAWFSAQRFM
jgi:prepilin peptidase CpaA